MTGADERPLAYMGSLHFNGEFSAELGALIGEFAIMEFLLVKMLAAILNEDDKMSMSHSLLGHIQSVALRIDILESCIEKSQMNEARRGAFKKAAADIRTLNSLRNQYVHAVYETEPVTGIVRRKKYGTSSARIAKEQEELTAQNVRRDREKVIRTHGDIMRALFSAEIEGLDIQ